MISIFSKFQIAGGSERRCLEIANGIAKYFNQKVNLLCREKSFPSDLKKELHSNVNLVEDCFSKKNFFYESEYILVVNSDSKSFTKIETWESSLDMQKMKGKTIVFLFNFIVSPSRSLNDFEKYGIKLGIILTNEKFFKEISEKTDKFIEVAHIPRFILHSPIESAKLQTSNNEDKSKFIVSFLSKSYDEKWNDHIFDLINWLNNFNYSEKSFLFKMMGVKRSLSDKFKNIENVKILKENEVSLKEFFKDSDLFIFYPSYRREEPWARVIAEAMTCGLPIVALDNNGGTREQVICGNNGYLCKDLKSFQDKVLNLFTNTDLCKKMGKNSKIYSFDFSSENVCKKLLQIFKEISST